MPSQATDLIGCMIAGMHKCGTTSLRDQLAEHPGVATHPQLECPFYAPDGGQFESGGGALLERYFADAGPEDLLLAKHATACCDEEEVARIAAANPSCKVILTVRDPVARARSAYMMESSFGARQAPFSELVEEMLDGRLPESDWRTRIYLEWGRYDSHLDRLLRHFSPASVRVVAVEALRREPRETVDDLFGWLGLDGEEVPLIDARNVASEPRSVRLAAAVNWFLRDGNPLKPAVRRLIGDGAAARAGGFAPVRDPGDRREEGGDRRGDARAPARVLRAQRRPARRDDRAGFPRGLGLGPGAERDEMTSTESR